MADIARQSLVTIDPAAWPDAIGEHDRAILRDWAARGWPAIVRRPDCTSPSNEVPIGVPLPPSHGKVRVALAVPRSAILSIAPLPLLSDAAASAPITWQPTLTALLSALPSLRCYGSLAWQHVTGLRYISDTSDLDLFAECNDAAHADIVAGTLLGVAATAYPSLDGEIAAPDGTAVQWREWGSGAALVMVKSRQARLEYRHKLFA